MLWLYRDFFLLQINSVISAATIVITITIMAPTAMPIYPYMSSSSSSSSSSEPPLRLSSRIIKQNHYKVLSVNMMCCYRPIASFFLLSILCVCLCVACVGGATCMCMHASTCMCVYVCVCVVCVCCVCVCVYIAYDYGQSSDTLRPN